ncbi:MAG TPA: tetratricopeptide repeat protein [Candidatus Polarisedimenticolia bacterium]|nr:tetratricopeptide repeat protein [Candidatus Polarisedimenticolia bacterium]
MAAALVLAGAGGAQAASAKVDKKVTSQLKLAHNLYEARRLAEALGTVDKIIDEEPRYAQARLLRGMVYYEMGKMPEALREFDKTLDLEKGYTDARIYRGSVLMNLDRTEEALGEFEKALQDLTYPWPERIHGNIGMLRRRMGQPDAAIASLQKAVRANPSYAKGYFELGVTYESLGRHVEALKAYQDALVGMDAVPQLHLKLGLALLKAGSSPKARLHFERVLQLSPDGPEASQARDHIARMDKPSSPS